MAFVMQEGGRIGVKFKGTPILIKQNSNNDDGVTWNTDFAAPQKIYAGKDVFAFNMTPALEYIYWV
jgi:hypothetical protein